MAGVACLSSCLGSPPRHADFRPRVRQSPCHASLALGLRRWNRACLVIRLSAVSPRSAAQGRVWRIILSELRFIHFCPTRAPVRADSASRGLTGAGVVSLVRRSWRGVAGCPRCEGEWATIVPTGGDPSPPPELHSTHYPAGIVFPYFRTVTKAADSKPRHYPFKVRHDKQACHEWLTTIGL
jgi:hypothetical protein